MDSPIFGSSSKNRANHSNLISQINNRSTNRSKEYEIFAVLVLHKNLSKLSAFVKSLEDNKKRFALSAIRECRNRNEHISIESEASVVFEVEYKLNLLTSFFKIGMLKNKIKAWKQLCFWTESRSSSIEKRSLHEKRKGTPKPGKKDSEWKENSSSNVIDLPEKNKALKNEIKKCESEEAAFIASMKDMLEGHERFLGKGQGKKKK